jgi:hypothetical protein
LHPRVASVLPTTRAEPSGICSAAYLASGSNPARCGVRPGDERLNPGDVVTPPGSDPGKNDQLLFALWPSTCATPFSRSHASLIGAIEAVRREPRRGLTRLTRSMSGAASASPYASADRRRRAPPPRSLVGQPLARRIDAFDLDARVRSHAAGDARPNGWRPRS